MNKAFIGCCVLMMNVGIAGINVTSIGEFSQKVDQLLKDVSRSNLTRQELETLNNRLAALKQENDSSIFSVGRPEEATLEKGIPEKFNAIDRKIAAANARTVSSK